MLLPLGAVAACSGNSFSATGDDGGAVGSSDDASGGGAGDGTIIIYNDAGRDAHDATAGDAHLDAQDDVESDATVDAADDVTIDGPSQDGDGWAGCPTGDLTCNGQCVPNGPANCGSCGHDCTNLPHVSGTVSCDTSTGACSFPASSCAPGWADCNGNPDDGCETPISTTQNCGGCGVTCGATDPVCQGSGGSYACVTGCMGMTSTLCNGSCVDTNTDPSNCKTCGNICPTPSNGQPACTNGTCGVSCNAGYTNCSGACVDTTTNNSNCGQCGMACSGGEQCVGSTCQCTGGTHLCSGTCVANDVNACGPNCVMCVPPANATPTCNGTSCGFQCDSGYTQCGNACDDLATDINNCGSCGKVCPGVTNGQPTCVNSACGIVCDQGYTLCNGACYGPDTTHGVFVEQGGATYPSCGTEAVPCGTLADALSVIHDANGAKTTVYIDDHSTINQASFGPLYAGYTVEGGWLDSSGTWTYDCAPTTFPTINITDDVGFEADWGGSVTIEKIVLNVSKTPNPGEPLYGVSATAGTTLTLQDVTISVGQGGTGSNGTAGTAGTTSTCAISSASHGASGSNGAVGTPGTAAYTSTGYEATAFSSAGGNGTDGQNGTYTPPQCGTACTNACAFNFNDGLCECTFGTVCGQAGAPGCAGTHGSGGNGGGAGGASTGVFVSGATAQITNVTITTSNGGAGGNGGGGGTAGMGSSGSTGTTAHNATSCSGSKSPCTESFGSFAGGVGGPGGNGGAGGQGGGGPGGDSYCVVYGKNDSVTLSGVSCVHGSGGAGGQPNGLSGTSGDTLQF